MKTPLVLYETSYTPPRNINKSADVNKWKDREAVWGDSISPDFQKLPCRHCTIGDVNYLTTCGEIMYSRLIGVFILLSSLSRKYRGITLTGASAKISRSFLPNQGVCCLDRCYVPNLQCIDFWDALDLVNLDKHLKVWKERYSAISLRIRSNG